MIVVLVVVVVVVVVTSTTTTTTTTIPQPHGPIAMQSQARQTSGAWPIGKVFLPTLQHAPRQGMHVLPLDRRRARLLNPTIHGRPSLVVVVSARRSNPTRVMTHQWGGVVGLVVVMVVVVIVVGRNVRRKPGSWSVLQQGILHPRGPPLA